MFFYRFQFGFAQVIGFLIGLYAGAIWLTFLYNRTDGSILMVALWHALWNMVNIFGLAISDDLVAFMSAFVMMAAVVIVTLGKVAQGLPTSQQHTLLS